MKEDLGRSTVELRSIVNPARASEYNQHYGEKREEFVNEPDSSLPKLHVVDFRVADKKADAAAEQVLRRLLTAAV